jgi:tetratricopeptide (TPR) repeat protein
LISNSFFNSLSAIYIDRKDFWRAESELKKELEINPFYDLAFFNLGRVYYERGLYQEAGALWRETLKVNPRHQEAARMLEFLNQNLKAQ